MVSFSSLSCLSCDPVNCLHYALLNILKCVTLSVCHSAKLKHIGTHGCLSLCCWVKRKPGLCSRLVLEKLHRSSIFYLFISLFFAGALRGGNPAVLLSEQFLHSGIFIHDSIKHRHAHACTHTRARTAMFIHLSELLKYIQQNYQTLSHKSTFYWSTGTQYGREEEWAEQTFEAKASSRIRTGPN